MQQRCSTGFTRLLQPSSTTRHQTASRRQKSFAAKRCVATSLAGIGFFAGINLANATEFGGSNYLPGFYGDFGMAAFPGAGDYFSNFMAVYRDQSDTAGTILEMPGMLHVSEQTWLGGRFVSGFFAALMASQDHSAATVADRFGLGDFYLVPAGLNWTNDNFSALLFEGVVAPTGHYQIHDFNLGRNYWTFDHNLLLTFNLPANNELSVAVGYMNNLENQATHYQSGDEFHFDYNLGHYFDNGVGVGIAGSHYRQVNRDEAASSAITTLPGEASSVGPSITYSKTLTNHTVAGSLKWLYEFDVVGRMPQEYLVCRVMFDF